MLRYCTPTMARDKGHAMPRNYMLNILEYLRYSLSAFQTLCSIVIGKDSIVIMSS